VNVNFRYVEEELEYLFDNADLRAVVTEPGLADRAEQAAATLSWDCPVIVADDRYERLLDAGSDEAPDVGPRSPDDRYAVWTGGTTGMPKGVIWRHEDIYLSALGGSGNPLIGVAPVTDLDDVVTRADTPHPLPVVLVLCPLMHAGGFWLAFSAMLSGTTAVLIRDVGFDAAQALTVTAEERASLLMTIGDAFARPLVDELRAAGPGAYDLSALAVYGSGGAILSPSLVEALGEVMPGVIVHDGFGASESGGQGRLVGTDADGAPRFEMDDSNGVLADDGTLCRPGDGRVGLLATTGHIPLEYHKDEKKTAETFPVVDGVRYATPGDMAAVDADGTIVVYGRGSVSINSGGEKIFPEEVEKALKSHPAVFDATVVGTPHDRFGSQVTAVVELRDGDREDPPSLEDLRTHRADHLAGYKLPRAVAFVEATVRSPSGKPDYRWAEEIALAQLAEGVAAI
jgi:acyl-CoA synthetase (AMP-forming)/AMP-acid ligase II